MISSIRSKIPAFADQKFHCRQKQLAFVLV